MARIPVCLSSYWALGISSSYAASDGETTGGFLRRAFEYYGWDGVLLVGFVVLLPIVVVLWFARTPYLHERFRNDAAFWAAFPPPQGWFIAVLYSEEIISTSKLHGVRRLSVTLKHHQNGKDRTIFRAKEDPFADRVDDTVSAFSSWIEASRRHGVPAVYRSGRQLHILSAEQIAEMEQDPVAFVARFQKHIRRGEAVPEHSAASALQR